MDKPDSLIVDLSNADDVRASMKRAEAILDAKREALRQREEEVMKLLREPQAEVAEWERKVSALETLAAAFAPHDGNGSSERPERNQSTPSKPSAGSLQPLVVGVVNREGGATTAPEVMRHLRAMGHDVDVVAVRNAMYYAAHTAKTILKLEERGAYAPLDYKETTIFDSAEAGSTNLSRDAVKLPTGEGTEGEPPGDS